MMPKKLLSSAALVGLLLSLSACGEGEDQNDVDDPSAGVEAEAPGEGEGAPEMPEPDTSDIPDVVAEVNSVEISGEEFIALYESQFDQLAMQAQMSGEEPDQDELKEQTLDALVDNELLVQEAEDRGFDADEDDIEELLEELAELNGMESVDDLMSGYEEQGLNTDQVREDARKQSLIDQLLDDLDVDAPDQEELQDYYDEIVAQQLPPESEDDDDEDSESEAPEPDVPEFEDVEEDLEEELTEQRQNEAAQDLLEELREDAEIESHL